MLMQPRCPRVIKNAFFFTENKLDSLSLKKNIYVLIKNSEQQKSHNSMVRYFERKNGVGSNLRLG